ncbi:MAG: hypothetical protein AAGG46_01770, partial [Planctomycetota bacterium]
MDGLWVDAGRWSTFPDAPNNDSPNPGDAYDATIAATGTPYRVELFDTIALDALTIGSPDATLAIGNGQITTPEINLTDGTLLLGIETPGFTARNASVVGATISGSGTLAISAESSGALPTLDGVSLGVDLIVPSTGGFRAAPRLLLRNGLEIQDGAVLSVQGRGALVDIQGGQTLSGGGELHFEETGSAVTSGALRISEGSTLTIGSNLSVRTVTASGSIGDIIGLPQTNAQQTLINNGVLSGEAAGRALHLLNATTGSDNGSSNSVFVNNGVVQAIGGGVVIVGSDWTNNGTFRVADDADLALAGVFTPADIGSIDRQGGRVLLTGRVENTGTTLTASAATGDLIIGSTGQFFSAELPRVVGGVIDATDGATIGFVNATLDGVTLAADAVGGANIAGDLTLDDAVLSLGIVDNIPVDADLRFMGGAPSQAIRGAGAIRFTGGGDISFPSELVIGEDIVVEAATGSGTVEGQSLVNNGVLRSGAGQTQRLRVSELVNRGTIEVAGSTLIGRNDDTVWRNEGTITVRPGGRLTLAGTLRVDDLGTLIDEGADTITLAGVLDNTGRTLDLEALDLTVPLTLNSGEIRGGVLTSSGDASLRFADVNGNVLNGVTLASDLTIDSSIRINVVNGLTLDDATITVADNADLLFNAPGPQFIDGSGTISLPSGAGTGAIATVSGRELVIGENVVLNAGPAPFREVELIFGENRGVIIADSPGAAFTIGFRGGSQAATHRWANNGLIRVDGSVLSFNGVYTVEDIGTVEFLSGEVLLQGTLDNEGRTVRLDDSTAPWKFRGAVLGGRIETADGAVADMLGSVNGVTLAGDAVIKDTPASSPDGFLRVENALTLDGGRIVIESDAELAIAGHPVLLDGDGEIVLNGSAPQRSRIQLFNGSLLTIGQGVTIRTGPDGGGMISRSDLPVINHGTVAADVPLQTLIVDGDFQNQGVLRAANNGRLQIDTDVFVNTGRLELDG